MLCAMLFVTSWRDRAAAQLRGATKSFPLYFHCDVIETFVTLPVPDVKAVTAKYVVKIYQDNGVWLVCLLSVGFVCCVEDL